MDVVKEELVLWTRSSTWFAPLIESFISSIAFFIWSISLAKCGTLRVTIPLECFPPSMPFSAPPFFEFFPCSSMRRYRHCLLTSLVISWFCCAKFAITIAMDCSCCWTDSGGGGGGGCAQFGWLEVFPLSWCSRLVAIDLVRTMQLFCLGKQDG